MANTKQDFYAWVRQTYPGFWPENMEEVDWTLPYQKAKLDAWKAAGYPAGIPVGPSGIPGGEGAAMLKATRAGLLQPMVGGAGADTIDEYEVLYAGTVWRRKADGVYVDPDNEQPLSDEEFKFRRSNYYKSLLTGGGEGGGAGETPQWRLSELEFRKEQFEWEKQQAASQALREEQQAQQQLARTYEEYRRRLLSELTDPSDWITRWMVEQTPEKLPAPATMAGGVAKKTPSRILYDFEVGQGETLGPSDVVITDNLETAAKLGAIAWVPRQNIDELELSDRIRFYLQARDEGYNVGGSGTNQEIFQRARWEIVPEAYATGLGTPATTTTTPGMTGTTWADIFAQVKGTPGAPGWLPTFAPGQVTGRPITKERVAPPSGQRWLATPWSQRQGLGGFAEWGGQSFTDVLNQMAMMQTTTPRGAGSTRWAPRRQMTAV